MMTHNGYKHLLGKFEKLRIELAEDGRSELRKIYKRLYQRGIRPQVDAKPADSIFNLPAPLIGRQNHEILTQELFIVPDGDRNLRRAEPTMSASDPARGNARYRERDYLVTKQCNDPAYRANKPRSVFRGPVHSLGKVDLENDAGQR